MTNSPEMTQTIVNLADQLSGKSQWSLFMLMFILWLGVSGFAIRYMVMKRDESNDKLLKSEGEKTEQAKACSAEKEVIYKMCVDRLEGLLKESTAAHYKSAESNSNVAEVLGRFERLIEKMTTKT